MSEYALQLPEYDQDKFAAKYLELGSHVVAIPANMDVLGYAGINQLFSTIQGHLDRVSEMMAEATHLEAISKAVYEAAKSAYEAKFAASLAAKAVGEYESIKLIEAQVANDLAPDKRLMDRAKIAVGLFGAYRKAVEGKQKNLESAKTTLELQNNNYKRLHPPPQAFSGHGGRGI